MEGAYDGDSEALKQWRREVKRRVRSAPEMEEPNRDHAWAVAVVKQAGWKAPRPDGIHAYWLKHLPTVTGKVSQLCWRTIDTRGAELPGWLVKGRTVLIPKDECAGLPSQFR